MTRAPLLGILALGLAVAPASAAVFNVNSVVDAVDAVIDGTCASAAGVCTLRAAVQEANATPAEDDVINLPAGKYTLKLVGAGEDAGATGDLDLLDDVQIIGAGTKPTVIKGKKDRVVHVAPGVTASLSNLTVSSGKLGKKGELGDQFNGGGILADTGAVVTLQNVVVAKNGASDDGGGIALFEGTLSLTDVLITGNKAGDDAGGIDVDGGDATLTNVTISKNKAGDDAGGIERDGEGTLTLTNCTVSANKAAEKAGGVSCEQGGTTSLVNVTIKGNTVKEGGGAVGNDGTCSVTIHNALLDKNKPVNCAGAITLAGGNLESGASCGVGGSSNLKLNVKGLKNNGGATPTHALKAGSPAIDHGFDCPPTDQRGVARFGDCDTGAFEFQPTS